MPPAAWLDRRAGWILLLPCLAHLGALLDPPYWDNLTGAFPQGLWLARHGFDAVGLFDEKPFIEGGPRVYPFSLYPWLIGALYALGLAPKLVFAALHLVSLGCAWWSLCTFRRIARWHFEPLPALLVTLGLGCWPLFASLTAQMNMDMPLLCATIVAFEAVCARRGWTSFLAAAIALHVKPTGILVAAAVACVWAVDLVRARNTGRRAEKLRAITWFVAGGLLCALGFVEAWLSSGHGTASVYFGFLVGVKPFLEDRMWLVPEFGLLVLVFFATLPAWFFDARRNGILRGSVEAVCFLIVTAVFYAQFGNTLPRYFLQSLPLLYLWFLVVVQRSLAFWRVAERPAIEVLAVSVLAANLVNWKGLFYSDPPTAWLLPGDSRPVPANDGQILERSMLYRDDLLLEEELVRRAEAYADRGCILVAAQPVAHMLGVPEFGYTRRRMDVATQMHPLTFDDDAMPYEKVYTGMTRTTKRVTEREVVFVFSPSRFAGGRLGIWPGDEVLEWIEVRGRRAVILRRTAWEERAQPADEHEPPK